ncbi:MAG: hypothetical protein M3P18_20035 [Actinomycetota bacterium]|nr:hypothetical protein [Actinomycetota bacterium]
MLLLSRATLGYRTPSLVSNRMLQITMERNLASLAWRAAVGTWSDIESGLAEIALAVVARSTTDRRAVRAVGVWLLCAPLVFWAHIRRIRQRHPDWHAADRAVDPDAKQHAVHEAIMRQGPPGWTHNPSA